jgi:PAS domain S-box-containing protein
VTDQAGAILDANRAASLLLNLSVSSLTGAALEDFTDENDRPVFHRELARLAAAVRPEEWMLRLLPRNGPPFRAALTVAPIRDAESRTTGLGWIVRDVSDRARLEDELRRAREELEERIRERTRALATANASLRTEVSERKRVEDQLLAFAAKLSRSNRELEDFTSVAAHDLQEPLRKILVFGDRLRSAWEKDDRANGTDYLDRVQDAARRMQSLITDLFAFARVTTSGQPLAQVDLNETAREVLADLEVAIEQSGGQVQLQTLPTIEADPRQMRQLLQNLIGNALKFHWPGEPPLVEVWADSAPGAEGEAPAAVTINVRDHGIGFDPRHLPRLFTLFHRLHSRREYPGTGVGLAICRKIVVAHGGEITATSAPGSGAAFSVTLPVEQPRRRMDP